MSAFAKGWDYFKRVTSAEKWWEDRCFGEIQAIFEEAGSGVFTQKDPLMSVADLLEKADQVLGVMVEHRGYDNQAIARFIAHVLSPLFCVGTPDERARDSEYAWWRHPLVARIVDWFGRVYISDTDFRCEYVWPTLTYVWRDVNRRSGDQPERQDRELGVSLRQVEDALLIQRHFDFLGDYRVFRVMPRLVPALIGPSQDLEERQRLQLQLRWGTMKPHFRPGEEISAPAGLTTEHLQQLFADVRWTRLIIARHQGVGEVHSRIRAVEPFLLQIESQLQRWEAGLTATATKR